tara:strand:+ start:383 stop:769 length:387 start_codon:yes stop_codon:yes gene_type:complete
VPRLPVDGKKVIEHRITLGGVEREALKSLATSARITSVAGDNGILDELGSIDNITAKLAVIGFVLELLGITDLANFDDDGRVKAYNILQKISERAEEKGVASAAGKATLDTLIEILSLSKFDTVTYNA